MGAMHLAHRCDELATLATKIAEQRWYLHGNEPIGKKKSTSLLDILSAITFPMISSNQAAVIFV
jgi:hypothetical protein